MTETQSTVGRKICRMWYACINCTCSFNDANKFLAHWCNATNYRCMCRLRLKFEKALLSFKIALLLLLIRQENHTMWLQVNHQPEMRCYTPLSSDPPKIWNTKHQTIRKYFNENKWTKTCETQKSKVLLKLNLTILTTQQILNSELPDAELPSAVQDPTASMSDQNYNDHKSLND